MSTPRVSTKCQGETQYEPSESQFLTTCNRIVVDFIIKNVSGSKSLPYMLEHVIRPGMGMGWGWSHPHVSSHRMRDGMRVLRRALRIGPRHSRQQPHHSPSHPSPLFPFQVLDLSAWMWLNLDFGVWIWLALSWIKLRGHYLLKRFWGSAKFGTPIPCHNRPSTTTPSIVNIRPQRVSPRKAISFSVLSPILDTESS